MTNRYIDNTLYKIKEEDADEKSKKKSTVHTKD